MLVSSRAAGAVDYVSNHADKRKWSDKRAAPRYHSRLKDFKVFAFLPGPKPVFLSRRYPLLNPDDNIHLMVPGTVTPVLLPIFVGVRNKYMR